MTEPILIRVDEMDNETGTISKSEAHRSGILHRAFSIFLFTTDGNWILQRRAKHKYHSAGLWSNTCCGHPNKGEETLPAAQDRLLFEMGMRATLSPAFKILYRSVLENGLIEHEYDHIFTSITDEIPVINKDEVSEWRAISFEKLDDEIKCHPESFTEWFKIIYLRLQDLPSKSNY